MKEKIVMQENKSLAFRWNRGEYEIFPTHYMVENWLFKVYNEEEAELANAMAKVAEKSGMSANDLIHLFPAVLRMLKNDSAWAK